MTSERLAELFPLLHMGYAWHDVSGRPDGETSVVLRDANDFFDRMWGLDGSAERRGDVLRLADTAAHRADWLEFYRAAAEAGAEEARLVRAGARRFQARFFRPEPGRLIAVCQEVSQWADRLDALEAEAREAALRARDAELIFNGTQDGLFLLEYKDGQFRYIRNNPMHQQLTGITLHRMEGRTPVEVLGDAMGRALEAGYLRCVQSGQSLTYEETAEFSETRRHWLVRMTPLTQADGSVYLLGSRMDITPLRELQDERSVLLRRLNAMFAEHSAIMLIIEPQSGKIMDANPAACAFYGYAREEFLGLHIQDINVVEESKLKQQRLLALSRGQGYFLFPHRIKGGEVRLVDVYSCPIVSGNETHLFSIIFDVSDRERLRRELFQEKELLRVTLDSIGDCVVTTDTLGRITSLNQAAQELSGWTEDEAMSLPFDQVLPLKNETTGLPVDSPIQTVLATGSVLGLANHTVLVSRQGPEIPIADSAAPIRDSEGQVYGVVMVFRDVSAEKRQQEQILYLSYRDALTGLYNRRFIEDQMRLLDRPETLPLAVVMGDVNGLKMTNDVFGHEAGDLLLQEVARIFQDNIRGGDVVARWGGDEFLLLLPRTPGEDVQQVVHRLTAEFSASRIGTLPVSVALGFAVKRQMEDPLPPVLQRAEEMMYHQKLLEGQGYRSSIVGALLNTLQEKSMESREHLTRLDQHCAALARAMNLSPEESHALSLLALLHDIGKVGLRPETLQETGLFTKAQWKDMHRHTEIGYRIAQNAPDLSGAAEYILCHHERWDGGGYPRGLKGEATPLLCRMFAVADAYDAMTSHRPYRKTPGRQAALAELRRGAGTQFDPDIVDVFLALEPNL